MRFYLFFLRLFVMALLLAFGYFLVVKEMTEGLDFINFLYLSNSLNYSILLLILIEVRGGYAIRRHHFLALPISDSKLLKIRMSNMLRNPWWFIPLTTPLVLILDTNQSFDLTISRIVLVYLSIAFTVSSTFWIWDYLKLHGWEKHLIGLFVLPMLMLAWIPKLGDEIWLLTNPYGGWLLSLQFLFQEYVDYQPAAIVPALGLLSLWLHLMLRWSKEWYYLANE